MTGPTVREYGYSMTWAALGRVVVGRESVI
jgi:hypothetical protein